MKVYVVESGDEESSSIEGAFSTEKKAENYIDVIHCITPKYLTLYPPKEIEVDKIDFPEYLYVQFSLNNDNSLQLEQVETYDCYSFDDSTNKYLVRNNLYYYFLDYDCGNNIIAVKIPFDSTTVHDSEYYVSIAEKIAYDYINGSK